MRTAGPMGRHGHSKDRLCRQKEWEFLVDWVWTRRETEESRMLLSSFI